MLATASRSVNGRLRQQPFGMGAVLIRKDQAPFKKKEKTKNYNFKNSEPPLYQPLGKISTTVRQSNQGLRNVKFVNKPTSGVRIKKNHNIELRTIHEELRPLREKLDALTTRPGGSYGESRKGTTKSAQDLQEGDLVVFLR